MKLCLEKSLPSSSTKDKSKNFLAGSSWGSLSEILVETFKAIKCSLHNYNALSGIHCYTLPLWTNYMRTSIRRLRNTTDRHLKFTTPHFIANNWMFPLLSVQQNSLPEHSISLIPIFFSFSSPPQVPSWPLKATMQVTYYRALNNIWVPVCDPNTNANECRAWWSLAQFRVPPSRVGKETFIRDVGLKILIV